MSKLQDNREEIIKTINLHIPKTFSCNVIDYTYATEWDYKESADRLFFSITCSYKGNPISDHSFFYLEGFETYMMYKPNFIKNVINRHIDNFNVDEITGIIINDLLKFKKIQTDEILKYIIKTKIILDYNKFQQKLEKNVNNNQFEYLLLANEKKLLTPDLLNKWNYIINANKFDLI